MSRGRLVDLSHDVWQDMLIHPWMPKPIIRDFISREQSAAFLDGGVSFQQVHVTIAGSTGTILQVPFQFHADGPDLAAMPLAKLVDIPVVVIDAVGAPEIGPEVFDGHDDLADKAVLFHTGQSRLWQTEEYFDNTCYLAPETIKHLAGAGPALVGVDSKNTDCGTDQGKPAQHELLGAGMGVLTSLTRLGELPARGARLTVLPPRVVGMSSFPVRVVAELPEEDPR
ncbi:cyclase family protein [Actinokineospora sp. NPDC004072]